MSPEQRTDDLGDQTRTGEHPLRGFAVLCAGPNEHDEPAIAVWHIAVGGAFTGAWIMPQARVATPDAARRALILLERRPLLVWAPEPPLSVLAGLIADAGLPADTAEPWRANLCLVRAGLSHIRDARAAHAAVVHDQPTAAAALQWQYDLPATDPTELADFLPAVRRAAPRSAAPVAYAALEIATAARWCLQAWQDTESVRLRRPILRQQFGPEQPAPPPWLIALHAQYAQSLPVGPTDPPDQPGPPDPSVPSDQPDPPDPPDSSDSSAGEPSVSEN